MNVQRSLKTYRDSFFIFYCCSINSPTLKIPLSEIDEHRRQNRMRKGVHAVKQNFSLNRSMDKSFLARRKHSNQANGANNEMHIIKQKFVDARNKKEMHYD